MARTRAKTYVPLAFSGRLHDARLPLAVVAFLTIGPCIALTAVLPSGLVLPVLGILLILAAGCTAAIAYFMGSDRAAAGFSTWDAAGFLAFFGCCAAMLSEPAQFLPFLEEQLAHRADPFPRDPPG